jgi:hypothetical protein
MATSYALRGGEHERRNCEILRYYEPTALWALANAFWIRATTFADTFNWHSQNLNTVHPRFWSSRLTAKSRFLLRSIFERQYYLFDFGGR